MTDIQDVISSADCSHPSQIKDVDSFLKTYAGEKSGGITECPLCPVDRFKPTSAAKAVKHLQLSHLKHAVNIGGVDMVPCFLPCKPEWSYNGRGHYHCICSRTLSRKTVMIYHVDHCPRGSMPSYREKQKRKSMPAEEPPTPRGKPHPSHVRNVDEFLCWPGRTKLARCPLCPVSLVKPATRRILLRHLQLAHLKKGVTLNDTLVVPCRFSCGRKGTSALRGHYHCVCSKVLSRRANLLSHQAVCALNGTNPLASFYDAGSEEAAETESTTEHPGPSASEILEGLASADVTEAPVDDASLEEMGEAESSASEEYGSDDDVPTQHFDDISGVIHPSHVRDVKLFLKGPPTQGGLVKCLLCPRWKFQPAHLNKLTKHLRLSHLKHAVRIQDFVVVPCHHRCRKHGLSVTRGHFHCSCSAIINRRPLFLRHLLVCPVANSSRVSSLPRLATSEAGGEPAPGWDEDEQVVTWPEQNPDGTHQSLIKDADSFLAVHLMTGRLARCGLCPEDKFKPAVGLSLLRHLRSYHLNHAIRIRDKLVVPCHLPCQEGLPHMARHYHCVCHVVFTRKLSLVQHVDFCPALGKDPLAALCQADPASASASAAGEPGTASLVLGHISGIKQEPAYLENFLEDQDLEADGEADDIEDEEAFLSGAFLKAGYMAAMAAGMAPPRSHPAADNAGESDSCPDTTDSGVLRVAFLGAGAINFGGAEGPWDHASRLETLDGVCFVAIVDPDTQKARKVLQDRQAGGRGELYEGCQVYASLDQLLAVGESRLPHVALVGIPPIYRGCLDAGKDVESRLVAAGIHVFAEKPLSVAPPSEFRKYVTHLLQAQSLTRTVVSVGYMFRYHAAVMMMKTMIAEHGGQVMAFNGRYYAAYSQIDHAFWWDIHKSGGPIVEQATHFCDLARFLVGDVDLKSVHSHCLRDSDRGDAAGTLASVPAGCEDGIAPAQRIPRVTAATWRFVNGAVGTLMHAVALHGEKYDTSLEVLMDGLRLTLTELYTADCRLLVRDGRAGSDAETVYEFVGDDPYLRELDTFLGAVRTGDESAIASPYVDAADTYDFSWAIRLAGEN